MFPPTQQPVTEQAKPNTSTQKPVDPANLPPRYDAVYQSEVAPFGNIPGYIYIQGYGYVKDEGGGVITGDNPLLEEDMSGHKIGSMG